MSNIVSGEAIGRLKARLGPRGWTDEPGRMAAKLEEWRGRWRGKSPILLLPSSTEEVAAIVEICGQTSTPITIQGGNTGLVGGQIPQGEVLVCLERMNRVIEVDPFDDALTVQAGVTLAQAHAAAAEADRRFPLVLASEGSCTIGGNIATNAGGAAVLRFGNMRDLVLGLEAVLPDGRVWNGLSRPRKDNTGYDLRHLLCGAEGTLGIVTAARLKLFPKPASRAVAMAGVESVHAALELLTLARQAAGAGLEAFELISDLGLELALRHIPNTRHPLSAPSPWLVLIETTSEDVDGAMAAMERLLEQAVEADLVGDAVIAQSEAQAAAFWALRENQSAAQKAEGQAWKNDISVPISSLPAFVDQGAQAIERFCPGARLPIFGHVGDGNLHYDILPPAGVGDAEHLARRDEAAAMINDLVVSFGGSISAEHGIGVMKTAEAIRFKDPVEISAYRAIRQSLDPKRILNPRVLF
jgi:FAD/FMN-containing dehydrogenase